MKSITEVRRRVKATWRDAQSFAEWLNPDDAKKYKPAINYSEGYVLIDNDDVDISNLHRQTIFKMNDTGKPKVEIAEKFLNSINPEAKTIIYKDLYR